MKDPAKRTQWGRVAPERAGPSRKRRPSPLFGDGHKNAGASAPTADTSNMIERSSPRSGRTGTAPLHGATPTDGVRGQSSASAHPARREARVPAGQHENAAPLGARSAGQSAPVENPAHLQRAVRPALAPAIVTVRPRRQGRLGGASPHRRDC